MEVKEPHLYKQILHEGLYYPSDPKVSQNIQEAISRSMCIDAKDVLTSEINKIKREEEGPSGYYPEKSRHEGFIHRKEWQEEIAAPSLSFYLELDRSAFYVSAMPGNEQGDYTACTEEGHLPFRLISILGDPRQVGRPCILEGIGIEGQPYIDFALKWGKNFCFEYKNQYFDSSHSQFESFVESGANNIPFYTAFNLVLILRWLVAKNITLVPHQFSKKTRKHFKRTKKGTQKYYTLGITTSMKRYESIPTGKEGNTPLHLCRGHLKHYTEEKPLFGKYSGTFFIPAHVRGNKKNGVVIKNYKLKN
jgi:hypothetical protein